MANKSNAQRRRKRKKHGLRAKLVSIFLAVKVIPLILLAFIAWRQFVLLGDAVRAISVNDSKAALNAGAIENIERMTTDGAKIVADFLYARDDDLLMLAGLEPTEQNYKTFIQSHTGTLIQPGEWLLNDDETAWVAAPSHTATAYVGNSTNAENNINDGFHYRQPDVYQTKKVALYDEITFVDLNGVEQIKIVADNSTKQNYPMTAQKRDVSKRENTYVKAETYFDEVKNLKPGQIYVSDVIGAYVGSNYIGMYAPAALNAAEQKLGYDIDYQPEKQAYSGRENPVGQRFEGIVRWATPVTDAGGAVIGYVTFALNHDHIIELVDHLTPMAERYTAVSSAFEGNYAFIWDYKCRNIVHPRHHSIVGYDPQTGEPAVPWLESSIYEGWQASGTAKWTDYIAQASVPTFDNQSRQNKPAGALTKAGQVGLDGRYLNQAPQCTGWMDLTKDGGSGSFYILWSGINKLTTAAAIPYYTGHYAPSADNEFSRRGFGFVTIGAGLEDFTKPATETADRIDVALAEHQTDTFLQLLLTTFIIIVLVVIIAIWMASLLTNNITGMVKGITRFRSGERQFRFKSSATDEFGELADSFDEMAESVANSVSNPLVITDMDCNIVYANEPCLHMIGKTIDEVVGQPYEKFCVYDTGSGNDPIWALKAGREADITHIEATDTYVRGEANYQFDTDGEKVGYIIVTSDITEMVREKNLIQRQNLLLDQIFSSSPDLIWYQDVQGRYLAVNPRFAAVPGLPVEHYIGKTIEEVLPPHLVEQAKRYDRQTISERRPVYAEETVTFADGHVESLDTVRTPVFDADGTLVGLLGFARNVTARVDIEKELRDTQIRLEKAVYDANKANEHKGEFLARMSHEIRTPMNAIIGISNIVLRRLQDSDDEQSVEVRGHVQQIATSSQHLLGLLNDILDISKIEAGKIELCEERFDLGKLLLAVSGIITPRCDEKNINFTTQFDSFDPTSFLSDPLRLRQVLINLLGNAVKFTPETGSITFSATALERKADRTLVKFAVRDSGIGIDEDKIDEIFRPFEQGDGSITRRFGGTGLGLAISDTIVRLFGGKIAVDSEVGAGSLFSFSIWLKHDNDSQPDEETAVDITGRFVGKHILLVDDVDINRMIVTSMLEESGATIEEADDGKAAVEAFTASPVGHYDLILMDVLMPHMDGHEASRVIRDLDRPDAETVPIVALTANAFKEDIDKAIENGMNGHIAKPVVMEKLAGTLARFIK